MKLLVFGQPSVYGQQRSFQQLLERCRANGWIVQQCGTTSRDDIGMMEAYDIVQTPALALIDDEGRALKLWQFNLPSYDELAGLFI